MQMTALKTITYEGCIALGHSWLDESCDLLSGQAKWRLSWVSQEPVKGPSINLQTLALYGHKLNQFFSLKIWGGLSESLPISMAPEDEYMEKQWMGEREGWGRGWRGGGEAGGAELHQCRALKQNLRNVCREVCNKEFNFAQRELNLCLMLLQGNC